MINARGVLLVVTSLLVTGCGTINTVFRSDDVVARNLSESKTYCGSIPRIYSGVFYDLCILNAPPVFSEKNAAAPAFIPLEIMDFIPSCAVDTVVLPYTIYRQITNGNIDI